VDKSSSWFRLSRSTVAPVFLSAQVLGITDRDCSPPSAPDPLTTESHTAVPAGDGRRVTRGNGQLPLITGPRVLAGLIRRLSSSLLESGFMLPGHLAPVRIVPVRCTPMSRVAAVLVVQESGHPLAAYVAGSMSRSSGAGNSARKGGGSSAPATASSLAMVKTQVIISRRP